MTSEVPPLQASYVAGRSSQELKMAEPPQWRFSPDGRCDVSVCPVCSQHGPSDPNAHHGVRNRPGCSVCRDAGLEWKRGICNHGYWTPKLVATGPLNPRVWSKLPPELLESIFARLPTDAIGRVRCLSKEWRRMASSSSRFTLQSGKFQPNLWAMIGFRDDPAKTCWVRAYDTKACMWHTFEIASIPQFYRNAIKVFDGGLGCFVPCGLGEDHQPILVCNPLTGERRQLPLPRLVGNQPRMAQLRVDRNRGTYKVIVVGHVGVAAEVKQSWGENNPLAAEVYASETKEWSALVSGKVLAAIYFWRVRWPVPTATWFGVYDCSTGVLCEYHGRDFPRRPFRNSGDEVSGDWGDPRFTNHCNDLFLLEAVYEREYDEETCVLYDNTYYNVLRHDEDNWGLGPNGPTQVRTTPNEFLDFEVEKWNAEQLLVCKSFYLMIVQDINYMRLYDRENKIWYDREEFQFDFSDMRDSLSATDLYELGIGELHWDSCPSLKLLRLRAEACCDL